MNTYLSRSSKPDIRSRDAMFSRKSNHFFGKTLHLAPQLKNHCRHNSAFSASNTGQNTGVSASNTGTISQFPPTIPAQYHGFRQQYRHNTAVSASNTGTIPCFLLDRFKIGLSVCIVFLPILKVWNFDVVYRSFHSRLHRSLFNHFRVFCKSCTSSFVPICR